MQAAYLDNNATTPPSPAVRDRVLEALSADGLGNASSPHTSGRRARARIEGARDAVARLTGADPLQVVFTSGCTEANNTVLQQALEPPRRLITSATEHASVREPAAWLEAQGIEVTRLSGPWGRIDPAALAEALERPAALVSIQWANGETGVLQPIAELAEVCRAAGVPLHVDAAQAVGREPIGFEELGIDYLSFSGHKLHAPQGVGALLARDPQGLPRLLRGGGQEGGCRAGTENLPGIVGLGAACEERAEGFETATGWMRRLRDRFEAEALAAVPGTEVNAHDVPRVGNTTSLRFPVDGQAMMAQLEALGVHCSQSSACSGQTPAASEILTAVGLSAEAAFASVRFSVSAMTTEHEIDQAVRALATAYERLRALETL